MAQRTIHYLIGEDLIGLGIRDVDRFRIGNVLPDAIEDLVFRNLTHYQVDTELDGKSVRYSDFERFRREFAPLVETDDLYLGYYMHLVEDACYRIFWHKVRLFDRNMTREKVAVLHNDYHLLNAYIVSRYHIRDELVMPARFSGEPINRIYPFLLESFLAEARVDFTENPAGEMCLIDEAFVERYVSDYLDTCCEALRRLRAGRSIDPRSMTW